MQKAILLANRIKNDLEGDFKSEIEDENLYYIFESIYKMKASPVSTNALICAIIYSYDNESKWIDLRQDGVTINTSVLRGLKRDIKEPLWQSFLEMSHPAILEAIGKYLDELTDWRFVTVRTLIDFHMQVMNMKKPAPMSGEEILEEDVAKALENRGKSIKEAIRQRQVADEFIKQIQSEYVKTDHITKETLGKSYTEEEVFTKKDILSWETFIRHTVIPEMEKKKKAKLNT